MNIIIMKHVPVYNIPVYNDVFKIHIHISITFIHFSDKIFQNILIIIHA